MTSKRISSNNRNSNLVTKDRRTKKTISIKKVLIFLLIVAALVFGVIKMCGRPKKVEDNDLTYNRHKSFLKSQNIGGIVFKDIECTYDGKNSLIKYTIVNKTRKKVYLNNYDVLVQDKKKKLITKISASYKDTLKPKEKVERADSVVGTDLSKAHYMKLKLKTKKK
ncbi:MAG: hypothetical protein IJH18_00500 [Bacilli bacterium]|nr:hypothetical protein [Bacilli bacterium]